MHISKFMSCKHSYTCCQCVNAAVNLTVYDCCHTECRQNGWAKHPTTGARCEIDIPANLLLLSVQLAETQSWHMLEDCLDAQVILQKYSRNRCYLLR